MCNSIDFVVTAFELGQQKLTTAQTFRITDRRYRNVHFLAGLGKGWQLCGNHDRGHVLGLRVHTGRQIDAELLQHAARSLNSKRRLRNLVARAVKAHNQTKANQLVTSCALDHGDIFDALSLSFLGEGQRKNSQHHQVTGKSKDDGFGKIEYVSLEHHHLPKKDLAGC